MHLTIKILSFRSHIFKGHAVKQFFVYILKCRCGKFYTGFTCNLERRLSEHNQGLCEYTKERLPITLVFHQTFPSMHEAFCAEQKIKGWSRDKKKALIDKNFDLLCILSKPVKAKNNFLIKTRSFD
ncbi:MAG: Excinuclease ABC subunit C [candidate division TM6 bacterium GW2011_GWF2_32_72]|nr:MAG: Excinuclease ABC subunit C [candidate division TM6 bacterium GW2011_GWF2_32_72]